MSKATKTERQVAREQIIKAVNAVRIPVLPYRMRHLEQCVHIARKRRLVKSDVLERAGFNPRERR